MALLYDSITTRYGDTFTADDDNLSTVVTAVGDSTNFSLSGNTLTVTSAIAWDGTNGSNTNAFDLVVYNKTIIFNGTTSRFTGPATGKAGSHAWFVNCTIVMNSDAGIDNDQRMGPRVQHSTAALGGREDTVTSVAANKSSETSWNYWNCTFVSNTTTTGGGLVVGEMYDCTLKGIDEDCSRSTVFPMNGSLIARLQSDFSSRDGSLGANCQLFGHPIQFDDTQFVNTYAYLGGNGAIDFIEYDAVANATAISENTSGNPELFQFFGGNTNTENQVANFVNMKAPLNVDGRIWWRHQAGGGGGAPSRAYLRERWDRQYFSDANQTTGRQNVRIYFSTDVEFETGSGDEFPLLQVAADKHNRVYESRSDGRFEGTYDFADGTTESSDTVFMSPESPLDLPLQELQSTSLSSGNTFSTNRIDYETDVVTFSLWGTTYMTDNRSQADIRTTADANGYFIVPNTANEFDPPDPVMEKYEETISNVTGVLTASTGSLSFNDIIANYKHCAWDDRIGIDNWNANLITGSHADIHGDEVDRVGIASHITDTVICGLEPANTINFTAPVASGVVSIDNPADEVIQQVTMCGFGAGREPDTRSDLASTDTDVDSLQPGFLGLSTYVTNSSSTTARPQVTADFSADFSTVTEIRLGTNTDDGNLITAFPSNGSTGHIYIWISADDYAVFEVTRFDSAASVGITTPMILRVDSVIAYRGLTAFDSTINQLYTSNSGTNDLTGYEFGDPSTDKLSIKGGRLNVWKSESEDFSGDGTQVKFDTAKNIFNIISVTVGGTEIAADDYTVANNSVTFDTAPASGTDNITIQYYQVDDVDGLTDLRSFSSTPSDLTTQFSLNDLEYHGEIVLSGSNNDIFVFHDIPAASEFTLKRASGDTNSYSVIASGVTNVDSITIASADASNITIDKSIDIVCEFPPTETVTTSLIGKFAFLQGDTETNARADTVKTTTADYSVTADDTAKTLTFTVTVPEADDAYYAIAIDGYEIVRGSGDGVLSHPMVGIAAANLDLSSTNQYTRWGTNDISDPVTSDLTTDADDGFTFNIPDTGFSITPSQATDTKVRAWLRKKVMEHNNFMRNIAIGDIEPTYFDFQANFIEIPTDSPIRFRLTRSADTGNSWRLGSAVQDTSGTDLFDLLTNSGSDGTQVEFSGVSQGATITQIVNALQDQSNLLFGTTDYESETERTLDDVYNMAKKARNANFV